MKDKICPMLSIGIFANVVFTKSYDDIFKYLPKCPKEDCRLWIDACLGRKGYCGLIEK